MISSAPPSASTIPRPPPPAAAAPASRSSDTSRPNWPLIWADVLPAPLRSREGYDDLKLEWGARYETSPSQILASGRGRCRASGGLAHRRGADLPVSAGELNRLCPSRRHARYHCAPDRPIGVAAAGP